jgi:hypothetical protein
LFDHPPPSSGAELEFRIWDGQIEKIKIKIKIERDKKKGEGVKVIFFFLEEKPMPLEEGVAPPLSPLLSAIQPPLYLFVYYLP